MKFEVGYDAGDVGNLLEVDVPAVSRPALGGSCLSI